MHMSIHHIVYRPKIGQNVIILPVDKMSYIKFDVVVHLNELHFHFDNRVTLNLHSKFSIDALGSY